MCVFSEGAVAFGDLFDLIDLISLWLQSCPVSAKSGWALVHHLRH